MAPPTRSKVRDVLTALIDGRLDREEASRWAVRAMLTDDAPIDDPAVRNALSSIGAADLWGGDRRYLYGEDDFRDWRREVEAP